MPSSAIRAAASAAPGAREELSNQLRWSGVLSLYTNPIDRERRIASSRPHAMAGELAAESEADVGHVLHGLIEARRGRCAISALNPPHRSPVRGLQAAGHGLVIANL